MVVFQEQKTAKEQTSQVQQKSDAVLNDKRKELAKLQEEEKKRTQHNEPLVLLKQQKKVSWLLSSCFSFVLIFVVTDSVERVEEGRRAGSFNANGAASENGRGSEISSHFRLSCCCVEGSWFLLLLFFVRVTSEFRLTLSDVFFASKV
jgi:hypothetical protein